MTRPPNILCLASYFKGNDFIRECKREGAAVTLITRDKMAHEDWAGESLEGIVTVSDKAEIEDFLHAASEVARQRKPRLIVALEEADVITAARVREYLCVDGMTTTTARCFRDKLAMRVRAYEGNIRQPEFVHLVNYQEVGEFMERVPPPWIIKPRADASAIGIHKLFDSEQVWRSIDDFDRRESLRERAPAFMLERFVSGEVYHVNSLVNKGRVVFADASHYAQPPLVVSQRGGVSVSHSVLHKSDDERALLKANRKLIADLGLAYGTTHVEFIKSDEDGGLYFLEAGARVGGAHTSETLEAARGINLWREWARIELAQLNGAYKLPPILHDYGGSVVSLARQEYPDTSRYVDDEIVYRVNRSYHVGLVVRSRKLDRVLSLLEEYASRFTHDFMAVAPQQERVE